MTVEALNREVGAQRGKSGGWPQDLIYAAREDADGIDVTVSFDGGAKEGVWKRIDPWGFAFLHEVKEITAKPLRLTLSVHSPNRTATQHQYEALKRRVSFLAAANHSALQVTLVTGGQVDGLYPLEALAQRPGTEITHTDFPARGADDTAGRLEKDFQAYLFGKGRDNESDAVHTNERLALFGDDFVGLRKLKSRYVLEREFPTGVFTGKVEEKNRILPTEFVDLVTLNKNGDLAIIEIKFDDPKLEVISQILNYTLFFHSYRSQLTPLLNKKLGCATKARKLVAYLVSNTFHKRFKSVWPYYTRGPLAMKQVILGYMPA